MVCPVNQVVIVVQFTTVNVGNTDDDQDSNFVGFLLEFVVVCHGINEQRNERNNKGTGRGFDG
jgi:hypothetical protein